MTGGIIRDNEAEVNGGGVEVRGTFKMYGGEISRNRVSRGGGGGVSTNQGSFEMHGGRIVNNTVTGPTGYVAGGGILLQTTSEVKIYKGEITGNDVPFSGGHGGGGIYVSSGPGTATLTFPTTMPGGGPSGPVVIGGNTTGSVSSPNSFNVGRANDPNAIIQVDGASINGQAVPTDVVPGFTIPASGVGGWTY